jgi:hypothetical protein
MIAERDWRVDIETRIAALEKRNHRIDEGYAVMRLNEAFRKLPLFKPRKTSWFHSIVNWITK